MVYAAEDGKVLYASTFNNVVRGLDGTKVIGGLVTTPSGTPDMNVHVSVGEWTFDGTKYAKTAITDIAITSHTTLNKWVIIVADSTGAITKIDGTPAEDPIEPIIASTQIKIAYIWIPAADTTISSDQIYDGRFKAAPTILTDVNAPTSPTKGQLWHDATSGIDTLKIWNGSAWEISGGMKVVLGIVSNGGTIPSIGTAVYYYFVSPRNGFVDGGNCGVGHDYAGINCTVDQSTRLVACYIGYAAGCGNGTVGITANYMAIGWG